MDFSWLISLLLLFYLKNFVCFILFCVYLNCFPILFWIIPQSGQYFELLLYSFAFFCLLQFDLLFVCRDLNLHFSHILWFFLIFFDFIKPTSISFIFQAFSLFIFLISAFFFIKFIAIFLYFFQVIMCYWDIFALIHISIVIVFIFIWRSPIHVLISFISSHSFSFALLVFFDLIR